MPKPVFYRLLVTERPIVSGMIVTGRSALAISRSLVASWRPWPTYQTHGCRRRETKDSGDLSGRGRGNRCFCRRELITIVKPLSRPGSAKTADSVCLYSVYRKQERSLFTATLEQTSNVPTAIIRPRPTAGLWSPIPSIRSAMASLCRAARLLFDRCATAPETRPLPAVSPPIFTRPSPPPATSTDCPAQRCPTGGRR